MKNYVKEKQKGKLYNKDQFGYWEFSPEQYKEREAAENLAKQEQPKKDALAKIAQLEAKITPRRIRELATEEGKQWMLDLEEKIAKQRKKLKKEK